MILWRCLQLAPGNRTLRAFMKLNQNVPVQYAPVRFRATDGTVISHPQLYRENVPRKTRITSWTGAYLTIIFLLMDIHKRYTSNFYCPEFGAQQYETEYNMLADLMEKMIELKGKKKEVFHVRFGDFME